MRISEETEIPTQDFIRPLKFRTHTTVFRHVEHIAFLYRYNIVNLQDDDGNYSEHNCIIVTQINMYAIHLNMYCQGYY